MPAIRESTRVCESCGSPVETTSSGDLGCMVCLLDAGLDAGAEENDGGFAPVPDQLGAYTVEHHVDGSAWELGHGAMGVTYRATDKALDRPVALKIINTNLGSRSVEVRQRFMREARAAAALRHPNVATVYQFGVREETGQFFYAMELVEGETLEERVGRLGPLDVLAAIDVALQVTAALAAAEQHGLVHRDLKPGNLMFVSGGEAAAQPLTVKVIDFGVAKAAAEKTNPMSLTRGGFVGTPAFASPEQFTNTPVDVRSDIYSLGVTLWFLLTGHMLFSGRTIDEIREARRSMSLPIEQLETAHVPRRFVSLLVSMLAIEPAARPAGARELGARLEAIRAQITTRPKIARRLAVAAAVFALVAIVAVRVFQSFSTKPASAAVPEKSIAVLPFENRNRDPDNTYFADGIQDEILTRLSKIADLKVISRTSTQHYKSAPENLPEIARQLGVAHILEGSVQKSGDAVRVNVQLIKAANDSHLWADSFDRKLTDIFSVESEVAKAIADQLRAKLTGQEEQVIAAKPTDNPEAYDAYLRGLAYLRGAGANSDDRPAQKYFREAVRLDPKFALGWALLSWFDAASYRATSLPPTLALREEVRQAAETALTLQPNLGEAVLAKGQYYYACLRDYDTALRYFEQARQLLPNSSLILESLAYLERRRGHSDQCETYFNQAERLDPRNAHLLAQHALTYVNLRRFPEALRKYDQVQDITPDDMEAVAFKALIAQAEGDLPRAATLLAPLHHDGALVTQVYQAILERRPAQVIPWLKEILAKPDPALVGSDQGELRFWLGWAQEVAGDHAAAQESWRQARGELEPFLKEQPENDQLMGYLALTNVGLGDKAAAFKLVERAMAVSPIEKDALLGPCSIEILARVAAGTGEPDRAIAALEKLLSIPYGGAMDVSAPLTPALLRLDPMFDPLRNDPRFQKLASTEAASAAVPEKSIAVLPLENLSDEKENAYFADGIQDELLSNLAKIKDLKVISRTSVMQYKSGITRNLKEIARQLGVGNVVEGSVRRAGNRVRVSVQLIDALTDRHIWVQNYDRTLADSITLQDELATEIAAALGAALSPQEKARVEAKPTDNPAAYDAYLRARAFAAGSPWNKSNVERAIQSYQEAVKLDPNFVLAWAYLSCAQSGSYWQGHDPTPARLAAAKDAADHALALDPNLPETHLALGYYRYWGQRDFTGGLAEFQQAEKGLPNNVDIINAIALVQRRLGHWEESIDGFRRVVELDPRNSIAYISLAVTYSVLRRFPEALATGERVLAWEPANADALGLKASVFWATGDLKAVEPLLANPGTEPRVPGGATSVRGVQALFQRRYAAAIEVFSGAVAAKIKRGESSAEEKLLLGLSQQRAGDVAAARATYQSAAQDIRRELEKVAPGSPAEAYLHVALGQAYAGLGEAASAIAEGQKAMAMDPTFKDPFGGPAEEEAMARIYALLGDADHAIPILKRLLQIPCGFVITPALLRLDPVWDQIRNDPRFQELAAETKP